MDSYIPALIFFIGIQTLIIIALVYACYKQNKAVTSARGAIRQARDGLIEARESLTENIAAGNKLRFSLHDSNETISKLTTKVAAAERAAHLASEATTTHALENERLEDALTEARGALHAAGKNTTKLSNELADERRALVTTKLEIERLQPIDLTK